MLHNQSRNNRTVSWFINKSDGRLHSNNRQLQMISGHDSFVFEDLLDPEWSVSLSRRSIRRCGWNRRCREDRKCKRQRLSWRWRRPDLFLFYVRRVVNDFPIHKDSAVFIPHVMGLIEEDSLEGIALVLIPKGLESSHLNERSPLTSQMTRRPSCECCWRAGPLRRRYSILSIPLCSAWTTLPRLSCCITNYLPSWSLSSPPGWWLGAGPVISKTPCKRADDSRWRRSNASESKGESPRL